MEYLLLSSIICFICVEANERRHCCALHKTETLAYKTSAVIPVGVIYRSK